MPLAKIHIVAGRYDEDRIPQDEEGGHDEEMPRVQVTRERLHDSSVPET